MLKMFSLKHTLYLILVGHYINLNLNVRKVGGKRTVASPRPSGPSFCGKRIGRV